MRLGKFYISLLSPRSSLTRLQNYDFNRIIEDYSVEYLEMNIVDTPEDSGNNGLYGIMVRCHTNNTVILLTFFQDLGSGYWFWAQRRWRF
jgi:hypothetical protein